MLKKLIGTMAVAALMAVPAQEMSAQMAKGYTDIGGVVGLGGIGSAGLSFGGRFERVFKELPDLGNGLLGIGVSADYYSYGDDYGAFSASFKYIPISATANYHFKLENKKFDAFVGAGLGYYITSCDYPGLSGVFDPCSGLSTIYFVGRVGGRYFYKPNMAIYADAGAGAATLNVGLTFKLK
ncbi:MAG: hypothetical protein IT353_18995 [Gemmatimonadaceae bacterium]|nr:hypothetical protein [Gemmatimonadaceae bacterium]